MTIHGIFYVIYLIGISVCADRFHKSLRTLSNLRATLNHPQVKKELIWKEIDLAKKKIKRTKRICYFIIIGIWAVHQSTAIILSLFFSLWRFGLDQSHLLYPLASLAISLLILQIIFWLKGKGGGVPDNKAQSVFSRTAY